MNHLNDRQSLPALVLRGLTILLVMFPCTGIADSWHISAEEWSRPRSGHSLVAMEGLVNAVQAFNQSNKSQLLVRYPGGEEGALWASELKDWLVSLGVPSSRIKLRPGQSSHEHITLMLKK